MGVSEGRTAGLLGYFNVAVGPLLLVSSPSPFAGYACWIQRARSRLASNIAARHVTP